MRIKISVNASSQNFFTLHAWVVRIHHPHPHLLLFSGRLLCHHWLLPTDASHHAHAHLVVADGGVGSKHLVVALFSIYQFQFIELHVVFLLFDEGVFLNNLFVQITEHFQVFRTRWPLFIEFLYLRELFIQTIILFLEQIASILKLELHLLHLPSLFLNHSLHLLPEVFLQNLFFFVHEVMYHPRHIKTVTEFT